MKRYSKLGLVLRLVYTFGIVPLFGLLFINAAGYAVNTVVDNLAFLILALLMVVATIVGLGVSIYQVWTHKAVR